MGVLKNLNSRIAVFEKCNGRCAYCGIVITMESMHVDHLIPKRRGSNYIHHMDYHKEKGSSHINNLMPSCASCNTSKCSRTLEEFRDHVKNRIEILNKSFSEYRCAKRFGLITENQFPIIFYFEKQNG